MWTQISVDEELGLAYLPVETPTSDFYGGHRPGNNLFAESLVAVDLKTGVRKWHFQFVHHPIWNFDNCCAPLLADIDDRRQAAQGRGAGRASRRGSTCSTARPAQPIWPIEERPVPQSDVPGEKTSPTQPHPTKPPPYARNFFRVPDDLIDFTPELRQQALEVLKRYKYAPTPFNPPILGNVNGPLLGAHRPRHGDQLAGLRVRSGERTSSSRRRATCPASTRSLVAPPQGFSDIRYLSGVGGRPFQRDLRTGRLLRGRRADARTRDDLPRRGAPAAARRRPLLRRQRARQRRIAAGEGGGGLTVQGLPIVKPPYGVLTAINLDRGEILWQVPHGDTPDNIRNHPALKGLNIPKTGQAGTSGVGLMVTKTLVVMGDPQVTATPATGRAARCSAPTTRRPARRSARSGCPRRRADRR